MVFIGKSINPVDNVNAMETLGPLWLDKSLTQNEKALTYTCAVLNNNIAVLTETIYDLQKQIKELKNPNSNDNRLITTESRIPNNDRSMHKHSSKKSSKSKHRIKEINKSIRQVKESLNELKKLSKK